MASQNIERVVASVAPFFRVTMNKTLQLFSRDENPAQSQARANGPTFDFAVYSRNRDVGNIREVYARIG